MNLEELESLKELNELDLLYKITDIIEDNYGDAEAIIKQRGWKASGVRVRDNMQDVKLISEIIRDKIQIRKGVKWGDKRKFVLDKAIENEKTRLSKQTESNRKRKQERINNIGI